jgi:hypothetical protein
LDRGVEKPRFSPGRATKHISSGKTRVRYLLCRIGAASYTAAAGENSTGTCCRGAPVATLLLPRGETMPCLSWLVNARSRGVRGSGPPGFRRGLDATDRAGCSARRGPNRSRRAAELGRRAIPYRASRAPRAVTKKCPRAALVVEVRAILVAYRTTIARTDARRARGWAVLPASRHGGVPLARCRVLEPPRGPRPRQFGERRRGGGDLGPSR